MNPLNRDGRADCGPFRVYRLSGNVGDYIDFDIPLDHPDSAHPNVLVYIKGKFHRVAMSGVAPDPDMYFLPGDLNAKLGHRRAGYYRLTAVEDGSVYMCVSRPDRKRPKNERLTTDRLEVGQLGVVIETGAIMYAKTDAMVFDKPVTMEVFTP